MVSVHVSSVTDFAALSERWRDLERRADGSFFQSWTWVGCLAAERYPDPVLVEATEAGQTIALGLFNRVRHWLGPSALYLAEAGSPEFDSPYIEQNGILTQAGHTEDLARLCLHKLAATSDLVLSGVGQPLFAAAKCEASLTHIRRCQPSWYIDLDAIRRAGNDYLSGRSANTRQQIRRSDRAFAANGPITLTRADSLEAAHAGLDQLATLHQSVWQRRGEPGSFASPFFGRFHHALIEAGFPRREIAIMRISSGCTVIGYLYNFIWRGRVAAYQSGFVYPEGESRAKPGLTCHFAAIRDALHQGFDIYDFLAGDDRYKRSLADQCHKQYWIEAGPSWSPRRLPFALIRHFRSTRVVATD